MPWYKSHSCASSGYSKWKYTFIYDYRIAEINKNKKETRNKLMGEMFERIHNCNTDGEHYRGVEWSLVKIENVPREVLDNRIKEEKSHLKSALKAPAWHRKRIRELKSDAKKCKAIEVRVKCKSCKGKGYWKRTDPIRPKIPCVYCKETGKVKPYDTW